MSEDNIDMNLSGNLEVKQPFLSDRRSLMDSLPVSAPLAAEWIRTRRRNLRSWNSFANVNNFKKPSSTAEISKRLLRNVEYFQSNYLCIFLGLMFYCIITSPFLLIAIAASFGACYILKLRNAERRFFIFGREVHLAQQYMIVALCSVPVFILAGAGFVIFWILGVSFFLIGLHAAFFMIESIPEEGFDLQMETV